MTYYNGFIAAVPTSNRREYIEHSAATWPLFERYGARRLIETWGIDVKKGKITDFQDAVQAKDNETVVFSWLEWPDKATADKAWESIERDPDMQNLSRMPFDGSRMIYGGFEPIMTAGQYSGAGYYQGFILAVPEKNKAVYTEMARDAWDMFEQFGCLGIVENWGVDIPRGKLTDLYRGTKAEDGEAVLFSWTAWPDQQTCDDAAEKMQAAMAGQKMPEMPFDGMRMVWGGFEPIFDSSKTQARHK